MGCDLTTGTTPVGIVVDNDGQTRFGFVVLGSVGIFFAIVGLALDGQVVKVGKVGKRANQKNKETKRDKLDQECQAFRRVVGVSFESYLEQALKFTVGAYFTDQWACKSQCDHHYAKQSCKISGHH